MIDLIIAFAAGFVVGCIAGFIAGIVYTIDSMKKKVEKLGFDTIDNYFNNALLQHETDELSLIKHPELAGSKEYQEAIKDRKKVKD